MQSPSAEFGNGGSYQCPVCGFHYREKETALRCEAWCRTHKSCSMEITKMAIKNQPR